MLPSEVGCDATAGIGTLPPFKPAASKGRSRRKRSSPIASVDADVRERLKVSIPAGFGKRTGVSCFRDRPETMLLRDTPPRSSAVDPDPCDSRIDDLAFDAVVAMR